MDVSLHQILQNFLQQQSIESNFDGELPKRNSLRFYPENQTDIREKFDGTKWRRVCNAPGQICLNFATTRGLCGKHRPPNERRISKKKVQRFEQRDVPLSEDNQQEYNENNNAKDDADDDEIQIIHERKSSVSMGRSRNSITKSEPSDSTNFNSCSRFLGRDSISSIKIENQRPVEEIEFLGEMSKTNSVNTKELLSRNIPPLTEFEEDYLANSLIQALPDHCSMIDARLYLHREAINVVKKNFRTQMETIANEYFYDFLLRHPNVPIHFARWFSRVKPFPPINAEPIDTKLWTLAMMVRGATANDPQIDECDD